MSAASEVIGTRCEEIDHVSPVQENGATLEMQTGERVHLELLTTGERIWGELVGNKQGSFLLVSLPNITKYRNQLGSETMVAVRALNKNYQLCGFRTTISQVLSRPMPLLFLDYPASYEKLNLRRHERVSCLLPATLLFGGEEYKTMVTDLSTGGAGVVLDKKHQRPPKLAENAEVFLVFNSLKENKQTVVRGEVRSVQENDCAVQLGVKFDVLIDESRSTLEAFISEIKRYNAPL